MTRIIHSKRSLARRFLFRGHNNIPQLHVILQFGGNRRGLNTRVNLHCASWIGGRKGLIASRIFPRGIFQYSCLAIFSSFYRSLAFATFGTRILSLVFTSGNYVPSIGSFASFCLTQGHKKLSLFLACEFENTIGLLISPIVTYYSEDSSTFFALNRKTLPSPCVPCYLNVPCCSLSKETTGNILFLLALQRVREKCSLCSLFFPHILPRDHTHALPYRTRSGSGSLV